MSDDHDIEGPLCLSGFEIPPDWLDYNGHMTESRYLSLCSIATENVFRYMGIDAEYRAVSGSYFTLETHLTHLGELRAGDRVDAETQVLGADEKRLHLFHVIRRQGEQHPVASGEQMLIHVAVATGRSGPVEAKARERLSALKDHHARLPIPDRAGASIRMRTK